MRQLVRLMGNIVLLVTLLPRSAAATPATVAVSVDVLSDTKSVDLHPYLRDLTSALRQHWARLAAENPAGQVAGHREAVLELTLDSDGHLLAMRQQGASFDEGVAKVAWDTAKELTYPSLPTRLKGANLALRLHFVARQ